MSRVCTNSGGLPEHRTKVHHLPQPASSFCSHGCRCTAIHRRPTNHRSNPSGDFPMPSRPLVGRHCIRSARPTIRNQNPQIAIDGKPTSFPALKTLMPTTENPSSLDPANPPLFSPPMGKNPSCRCSPLRSRRLLPQHWRTTPTSKPSSDCSPLVIMAVRSILIAAADTDLSHPSSPARSPCKFRTIQARSPAADQWNRGRQTSVVHEHDDGCCSSKNQASPYLTSAMIVNPIIHARPSARQPRIWGSWP